MVVNILFSTFHIIHIRIYVPAINTPIYVIFMYEPPNERERLLCWEEVRHLAIGIAQLWLCLGDFNDIMSQEETSA